ncbi:MAG: hypothetical protein KAQ90_04435 [Melioribacteraceae bacterium]|nr:hypothetical protein [Melioribacteraceae bacterium]
MRKIILTIFLLSSTLFSQSDITFQKYLDGKAVYDICDDGKNIWVATNGDGIYKFDKKKNKWSNFSTNNNKLQLNFFYSITANKNYVWAGSSDGLFIYNKKRDRWSKRKFGKGGQLSNWIRSVEYDPYENVVWIGRFKYLTKYDIKKKRFYDYDLTMNENVKTNTIKIVKVDGDSLVWFGTEAGLHKYDKSRDVDDEGTILFYDNRLNYFNGEGDEVSISSILFEQGYVWIGLDEFITKGNPDFNIGGIYKFDRKNEWRRFDTHDGFRGNGIYDLELTGNYIWASIYQFSKNTKETYGRGIVLINRIDESIKIIENENFPLTVYSLHFDGKFLWFGTNDGIYNIDLTNKFVADFN